MELGVLDSKVGDAIVQVGAPADQRGRGARAGGAVQDN